MNSKKIDPELLFTKLVGNYKNLENWWPYREKEEILVSAILAQNTSWKNVEKALESIRSKTKSILELPKLQNEEIEKIIKSSGFHKRKSETIKALFSKLLINGKITKISREELLRIKGIGKETADSILLYYFEEPHFIIDIYTIRLFSRFYGTNFSKNRDYEKLKSLVEETFCKDVNKLKVFHAAIVEHSKSICTKTPKCKICIVSEHCHKKFLLLNST